MTAKEEVLISLVGGTDVNPANQWVSKEVNDSLEFAISTAINAKSTVITDEEVINAAAALNKAVATYSGVTVTSIGNSAFSTIDLTSISIPNSVTSIGVFAFSNNLLTGVTISNNIEIIERGMFEDNQLTSITIPDSVITIYENAFVKNQLTDVVIGNKVTTIGNYGSIRLFPYYQLM